MAKMKFKFDKQKVIDFLLQRGELVALGITGTIAAVTLTLGILTALGGVSSKEFGGSTPEQAILKAARELDTKIKNSVPDKASEGAASAEPPKWLALGDPERFTAGAWFQMGLLADSKRRNPIILAVSTGSDAKVRDIQMNVVEAPYLVYELDRRAKRVGILSKDGGTGPVVTQPGQPMDYQLRAEAQAKRLIVVSAAFPYKDQLEMFRKALRKDSVEELFKYSDTSPRFLGIKVMRREILSDSKETDWEPLYTFDKDGTPEVRTDPLKDLLREAIYDEDNPVRYADFIFPGLVTPLPKLAPGFDYPELDLTDVKADGGDKTVVQNPMRPRGPNPNPGIVLPGRGPKTNPTNPQPQGPTSKPGWVSLKEMQPVHQGEFTSRFAGTVYPFDPYGSEPDKIEPTPPGGQPPPPRGGGPGQPAGTVKKAEPPNASPQRLNDKCLVRFVDVDVQVGKTYQYSIQVRMANPNYGRPQDVAFKALADKKELESPWASTPTIKVPEDCHYYIVDQLLLDPSYRDPRASTVGTELSPADKYKLPVQIHHWVGKYLNVNSREGVVGDWVVAPRLLLHRGEPLARVNVEVEAAEWNAQKVQFELASSSSTKKLPSTKTGLRRGAAMDFVPTPTPTIIDFVGGKRTDYPAGKATLSDEGSYEVLLLIPDGKDGRLTLRNSRTDSDPETPEGQQRQKHFQVWHDRLEQLRQNGMPGPAAPKGGR